MFPAVTSGLRADALRDASLRAPRITAVVPTLDEAACAPATVVQLASDPRVEVLVVDGGSRDGTLERLAAVACEWPNVRVLSSRRGRGPQLRAGAEAARGEILWFVHADTRLPEGAAGEVLRAVDAGAVAGAFRLRFDGGGLALRAVAWGANLRVALTGVPFGDQALFARRDVCARVGGVPPWPLFEDVELARRLRRAGPLRVLAPAVVTSARRYREHGVVPTMLANLRLQILYAAGVSPERLAALRERRGSFSSLAPAR